MYEEECIACPSDSTTCDEMGTTLETLPINPGYWRSDKRSLNIIECFISEACAQEEGGEGEEENENGGIFVQACLIGHTGPACDVCFEGYTKVVGGVCEGEG